MAEQEDGQEAPSDKPKDDQAEGKGEGEQKAEGGSNGKSGDKPRKPNPLKKPAVRIGILIALIVIAVIGVLWWLHARQYQKTDDAFVDTHMVRLAPQVPGQVSRVLVADNAFVQAGQPLVEIDASSARASYQQALGQRTEAEARIEQARAQIGVSEASARQARDQTRGLDAQADAAEKERARVEALFASAPRAIARQDVDNAAARARAALAQRDAAVRQIEGANAQVRAARTAVSAAQAQLASINATISQSQITLGNTRISAPVEGFIAQKTVTPGAYVQPGQQLMAIVPRQMWVTANFKETQLKLMRVGQPVDIKIDACPTDLTGKVASIQRGAGQAFSLLPSENATGNFVKVVQRVPVQISFDQVPKDCPLGPGLSVRPRVKVR